MFNENSTIEQLTIKTLQRNGWKYIPAKNLPRSTHDPVIWPMLKAALIRLNVEISQNPSRADDVIYKIRSLINSVRPQDLVTQNERFKKSVFDENSFPFSQDGRMTPIKFFGTLTNENISLNEYVFTTQFTYKNKRLDVVLFINGFPVAVGELKSPVRRAVSWLDAVNDINDYEQTIPEIFVSNVFNFATDGKIFRYGAVCSQVNHWGAWRTTESKKDGTLESVRAGISDMMTPEKVLDIMQFFTLFSTDDKTHTKNKIICRYQQYDGANQIINRVVNGYPKKGLLWHFQGSGKSLLMVFAAQKLRMIPALKNPTVVIVDDRLDLESQIYGTFNASDVPNLENIATKDELIKFFRHDMRKIAITTIFRFGDVDRVLNTRENIIVMVDEAHRTQEGDLGERMRLALPNAFFFGLTGTPVNRTDKNTFKTFGADEDVSGYMSKYSFSDSIRDGETLPLSFETVPLEMHVDKENLNREFDALTEGLSENDRAEISSRVNMKAIMYNPERIKKVCAHIVKHFREKIQPNGYKAQVVAYDRECCLKYKRELDALVGEEASTVIIDTSSDKGDKYKKFRRTREEEQKVLETFKDKDSPLKFLVVTSRLLTGFDAPVLQVMYLDKPMKDHTLLQAICRTNRTFDDGKTHGLIVDYVGIFDDMTRALQFDEAEMKNIISNIDELKKKVPELMKKCLEYFPNVDRNLPGVEGLMAAQKSLPTDTERDNFAADYRALNRVWDALSPDKFLLSFRENYCWLSRVYDSLRPSDGRGVMLWRSLGAKTLELVNENISVGEFGTDENILTLDAEIIDELTKNGGDVKKTAEKIEGDLLATIRKYSGEKKFQRLGEKVERLKEQHEQGIITSMDFLRNLLGLAKEAARAEKEILTREEFSSGRAALTKLFESVKNKRTPVIVSRLVKEIDDLVNKLRFDNWQNTTTGSKEIQKELRKIIFVKYSIEEEEIFNRAYSYIEEYY